jgi:hypothetical protein
MISLNLYIYACTFEHVLAAFVFISFHYLQLLADTCEHGNELSGFVKAGNFLSNRVSYQLFKDSGPSCVSHRVCRRNFRV